MGRRGSRKTLLLAAATVAALVGLGAVALERGGASAATGGADALAGRHVYEVRWTTAHELTGVKLPGAPAAAAGAGPATTGSSVDLVLGVAIHACRPLAEGGRRCAFTIERADTAELTIFGQAADARDHLVGRTAWLDHDRHGGLTRVAFAAGEDPLFTGVTRFVAFQAARGAGEWTEREAAFGRARWRWQGDTARLEAHTQVSAVPAEVAAAAAAESAGLARVERRADGVLLAASADETLTLSARDGAGRFAGRSRFAMRLVRAERAAGAAPAVDEAALVDGTRGALDAAAARKALGEQYAEGLTAEGLDLIITRYQGDDGPLPEGALTRAMGLLLAHPELCAGLAARFEAAGTGPRARLLIVEILTAAGHAEAQAALRAIFAGPAARGDAARRPDLLVRLSFLKAPEAATVALVRRETDAGLAAGDARLAHAGHLTLGAFARALRDGGDEAAAVALGDELLARLERASSEAERRPLLGALGNSADPRAEAPLVAASESDDWQTRAQAAVALRGQRSPAAQARLLALVADPERAVASQALGMLEPAVLDAEALAWLTRGVASGAVRGAVLGELVTLVTPLPPAATRALLGAVRARAADPRLRLRVDQLLARP